MKASFFSRAVPRAFALVLGSCASTSPPPSGVDVAAGVPSSQATSPSGSVAPATPRTASGEAPVFHLPSNGRALIGAPCSAEAFCGTRARIAVEEERYAGMRPREASWTPPCELVRFSREPVENDARGACLEAGYLYARAECRMCRMPSFREVIARVDELTPAQATDIAQMLGIAEPVPTTADDWARAIEGRRAR